MSRFYGRHVSTTLAERLKELEESKQKRLDLAEEVDMARILTLDAVKLYDISNGDGVSDETKAMARVHLSSALHNVSEMVKKAAAVSVATKEVMSTSDVAYVIDQVQRVLAEELGDSPESKGLIDRIAKRMQDIRLPEHEKAPTLLVLA